MKLRNNKGITLIALVITIIVLLILAGVALNAIAGENGILNKAKQAKEQTDAARSKEEMQLGLGGAYINKWTSENGEEEYNELLQELINENITVKGLIKNEYNENTDEEKDYLIVEQENQLYTTIYNYDQNNAVEQMLNNMKLVDASELKLEYKVFYDIWFNNWDYIWDGIVVDDYYGLYTVLVNYNSQDYLYKSEYNEETKIWTATLEIANIEKPTLASISNGAYCIFGLDTSGHLWNLEGLPRNINEEYNIENIVFTKISAGCEGVLMLDSTGKMWGYGDNWRGQLGSLEISTDWIEPTCISDIETNSLYGIKIIDISLPLENRYGLALDNTGKVYYFGRGNSSYFGTSDNLEPVCINSFDSSPLNGVTITKISAGDGNALMIDSDGKVWSFLAENSDKAGDANWWDGYNPICINDVEGNPLSDVVVTEVSAGSKNSMAIDSEGKIWSWGYDYGHNEDIYDYRFAQEESFTQPNYIVEKLDSLSHLKYGSNIPICLSDLSSNSVYGIKGVKVSAGYNHSLILDNQGKVWGFGTNWNGQLFENENIITEDGTTLPICASYNEECEFYSKQVVDISAGNENTGIVDSEGNYYIYGVFDNYPSE